MTRTWMAAFLLVLGPPFAVRRAAVAPAQGSPLRVLHLTPSTAVLPTEPVTVTFDRPVTGALGRIVDPGRVASLQPAHPARFDWRDPTTLRLVPLQPWPTGAVLRMLIDTSFVAMDGSRLTTPVTVTVRVRGPARRATSPPLNATQPVTMPPDGQLVVAYTSAVDTSALARIARYEVGEDANCLRRRVPLRVAAQRPLVTEDYQFTYAIGYDSALRAMARVVELIPTSSLPYGCLGSVVLPSLDSLDTAEIRYPIRTSPAFAYSSLTCAAARDCARSETVTLAFTVPLAFAEAQRGIKVNGAPADVIQEGPVAGWIALRLHLEPGSNHRITLDSMMRDIGGRSMTGVREITLEVGDRAPRVSHAAGFITQPRGTTPFLRVRHINVDSAVMEIVPLPSTGLASTNAMLGDTQLLWTRPGVIRRDIALGGPRNAARTTDIPLTELITAPAPQLVAVRLRVRRGSPGLVPSVVRTTSRIPFAIPDTMTTAPAVVQMTNLVAHARMHEHRGAILVTDMRRNAPLRDAIVTLRDPRGTVLARGITNSSGVAVIGDSTNDNLLGVESNALRPARLIEVEHAGDRAMLAVAFDHRNSLDGGVGSDLPLQSWGAPSNGRRALHFTDRDLYRPGERVYFSAVVRDGLVDQLRVPARTSRFRWVVQQYGGSDGPRVVFERDARFTNFGTSADSFDLSAGASLGYHTVDLQRQVDGQWREVSQTMFMVKEYRAPEFALTLAGDSQRRFIGDTLAFSLTGRYLYDAPMRGSTVRWNAGFVDASPWDLHIPRLPAGFGFGDERPYWERQARAAAGWRGRSGTETLNADGRAVIRVPGSDSLQGTTRVSFSVSVEDVNRQVVTSSREQVLYGSSFYLALRANGRGWWWRVGEPVRVQVLAVRPDGSRLPRQPLRARVIHERWVDSSGIGSSGRWIPDTIATWPFVSADSAITVSFAPRAGGYYTLELFGRDSAGRAVESRVRRFAFGGAFRPDDTPATSLPLAVDSIRHSVGMTASVQFDSPFDVADAWVTVEREGLLRQFHRPARRGPNEIAVAVSENMAPMSLVGVVLLNRGAAAPGDSLHRRVRIGMARLHVDSLVKRLAVTVAPARAIADPGSDARLNVRVNDYRGRGVAAAVTVWAVDEGVLSMGSYTRPDPAAALQAQYARWLALASTLPSTVPVMEDRPPQLDVTRRERLAADRMIRLRGTMRLSEVVMTGVGFAADAMSLAAVSAPVIANPRQDFRTTAFFRGMVLTDSTGTGTITVRLPDNITTYRLFAVAVGHDDRAGSAESTFVATRPLVVRAALPRFVRPGDSFLAGAAIGSRDGRSIDVRVEADATGITLTGERAASVRLDAGTAEARFAWLAGESDSARITLGATDGTNQDAVRLALPVRPDRYPTATSLSGVVRDTLTVHVTLPRDLDFARSRLTIRAGSTPLTLIDEAQQYLAQYPYLCTEQLLASAQVLVASLTLQRNGIPVSIDGGTATAALRSLVGQLEKRQRDDGAFGYWSRDSWSTPWLSTAVGMVMQDATEFGVRVDDKSRERLTAYLARSLNSVPFFPDTMSGTRLERRRTAINHFSQRLAAVSYLRRIGRTRLAEENALLERESLLAWEDRVLLARVLSSAGRTAQARAMLDRAWLAVTTAGLHVDLPDSVSGRGLFPSRVRPLARLVEATVLINPSHPRLGALMERMVSRSASSRRFAWNTQDYATVAAAVAEFTRIVPRGEAHLTAAVGAQESIALRTNNGSAVDSTISLARGGELNGDSVVFTVRLSASNGPIFYGLTTHEVSATPDARPLINGVTVERWYERFDNGDPATEVREGELVRVRLRVTVPNQRDFLAVEDPLPAGLEAVDLSLRTSGTLGPFSTQATHEATLRRDREAAAGGAIGSWDSGWWSPWEHSEKRDDRVVWFARWLPSGAYVATYVARATTAGRFIRPPARAEEMYNAATGGRSEGGVFVVTTTRR